MMGAIAFGQNLRAARETRKLTLRDIERITDGKVSNSYLSQLESGKIKAPSAVMVLTLASALSIDVNEMLAWLDQAPIAPVFCPTCGQLAPAHVTATDGRSS